MVILPRQSLFLLVCSLVLVCVLIGLLVPSPAQAGGAQPLLPGGSSLKPGEATPIQMAAEIITMNIRPATEADNALVTLAPKYYVCQTFPVWFPAITEVEAEFRMKNPTRNAVRMTAWFPLASALENVDWNLYRGEIVPRIETFQVSVDGNPVDYAVSELPNPKGADKLPLPWASFPLTFPGEVETVIHVSYMLPLQPSISGIEMSLYYIFNTGAGWAGPIGQAELILNLPYPASAETLAGIPSGGLRLPPFYWPSMQADLPSGAVLEGNQARWTWKDFEPGAEDDFAIWLLQPDKWQELETARTAVQANPQDGQAWLDLASTYHNLSGSDFIYFPPSAFSPIYLPPGIEAYQKAADLLPDHLAAHAGIALLTLAPYLMDKNAPPEVIQSVQDEYQIARELKAKNPSWAKEKSRSWWLLVWLERAFNAYFDNDVIPWVQRAAQEIASAALRETTSATPTEKLTLTATPMEKLTLTATPMEKLTLTPTPVPSTTPQPPLATPPTTAETTGSGQSPVIIVAAGVMGLVVVVYLALKRLRKRAGK